MMDKKDIGKKVWVLDGGNEIETTEYNIILMPLGNNLLKYLYDNGVSSVVDAGETAEGAVVEIEWGDWKHDHMWCDELMGYLGYTLTDEIETEENGSDCYSAERYYEKVS